MTTVRERPLETGQHEFSAVGKRMPRIDGIDKSIGKTIYVADMVMPGMVHAKLVRSPHAHAFITKLDVSKARAFPGVYKVLTVEDLPIVERDSPNRARTPLASKEVLFVGQPIVAVLAEDEDVALKACELVEVEYQVLPHILDPEEAVRPGARAIRGGSLEGADRSEEKAHLSADVESAESHDAKSPNIGMNLHFEKGDVEAGFAESDIIVEGTYRASSIHQSYMEPQATIATYDQSGELTMWSSTQGQFRVRNELSNWLGIPENKILVIGTEVGGGFGAKGWFLQPLVGVLAVAARRPVKLVFSRHEDLLAAIPTPQAVVKIKTGAKFDGSLTALKATIIYDAGAFPGAPLGSGPLLIGGYYRFPNFDLTGMEALTNKVGVGAYRAPGAPEVAFAIESNMAEIAKALGEDPIEFRLRHVVKEGDKMPHGVEYPPIGAIECLQAVGESKLWQRRRTGQHKLAQKAGKLRGIGVAQAGWPGGTQPASAGIRLDGDGTFTVLVGANDIAGTNTGFAQIAAEILRVPMDRVQVLTGDTASAPFSGATNGSKITYTVGKAVMLACEDAVEQILTIAAAELEIDREDVEFMGGKAWDRNDPESSIDLRKIANISSNFGARYTPIFGRGSIKIEKASPGFACHGVEVEIDPETGFIEVIDVVSAQDVGKAINPLSVEGQIQGATTQGLGIGLWERVAYSNKDGGVVNASLLDYRLPTFADVPDVEPIIVEVPSPYGPFGARLVGEPGVVPTGAAVADAVADAIGVRINSTPITPEKVIRALGKVTGGDYEVDIEPPTVWVRGGN